MNKVPSLQLIDDKPPLPECYCELTRLLNTYRLYALRAALSGPHLRIHQWCIDSV